MEHIYKCFPEGKFKVITMSYDDGKFEDKNLVSIFNKYGIKATFHVNYGLLGVDERLSADDIMELYKGHEIAGHTSTHPTIARCPSEQTVYQVLEDRQGLESITGYPVRGFSYPNGSYNQKIKNLLPHLGIRYARITGNSDSFDFPKDYYEWKPTCHHNHKLLEHAKNFIEFSKSQYIRLLYVWGHSYEFSKDGNWNMMEEFCETVSNRADTWYATNIEIVDYLDAWERLQFSADLTFVYNPSVISLWMKVNNKAVEIKGGEYKKII